MTMLTTEREPIAVAPGVDELGCDCCGQADCACRIIDHDGFDPETGPYSETVCTVHRCRV